MFFRKRKIPHWRLGLTVLLLGSGLTVFAYAAAQQVVRQSANIQPARAALEGALRLSSSDAATVIGPGPLVTQPGGQIYPDMYVYDEQRKPLATNIYGSGADLTAAVPPAGTFTEAKAHGEDRFTWKPANGPRQAAVLVHNPDNKGYVLATQSLVEPERIIDRLTLLAGLTLIGVLAVAVMVTLL